MNSIGRYQLVEKLGQGGMGVVYRAFDTLLQRVVAVKVISGSIEQGSEQRERFFREARAAGQLSHRNIITIHDLGEHEGQPYLAMEYLEGEDLQHRLTRPDRMSLARKVELAIEICEGLEFAHARGVVHRDIKPANIFITDNGTAKILDFGLARLVTSELTNSNVMMGTINYMAPEQVRGERADHRSDVFSFGVVFYELLGGRKAFEAESFASTLYKILQEVPTPLPEIDPGVPPELVGIVERALAKPRDERYQHMSELLRDLAVYRQHMSAYDSPGHGRPVSGGPVSVPASARAASFPGSDGLTIAHDATPLPAFSPRPASGAPPPATPSVTATPPGAVSARRRQQPTSFRPTPWLVAAALIVVTAFALWTWRSPHPADTDAAAAPQAVEADEAAVAAALQEATRALEVGDFVDAERQAARALILAPAHEEALRIRERAVATRESVTRGLSEARAHAEAGRFDEASRAAGDVLSLAPGQAEARQIMQEAAARSRGRGADEARSRMDQAKSAARAAGAPGLAATAYHAALMAERGAQRAYDAGDLADATARFYEAGGLFRSAELGAQTEAAARTARAETARLEKERADQARAARPEPPPSTPVTRGADPVLIGGAPISPKAPQAPAVPPPPAEPTPVPEPKADTLIVELLAHYEAALESRSLSALKRLWPGLGGTQEAAIRSEFDHASRIDVGITATKIEVEGGTATATFIRQYDLVTNDGQRLNSRSVTTMRCRRTDARWVIDQVRFEPIR
ncbi:MAG: protein kinase [Acidobacteria bacterium]|nr:protein kinase [Acidobacteriota bacterium]